jgi:hypothetical protein
MRIVEIRRRAAYAALVEMLRSREIHCSQSTADRLLARWRAERDAGIPPEQRLLDVWESEQ